MPRRGVPSTAGIAPASAARVIITRYLNKVVYILSTLNVLLEDLAFIG